MKKFKYNKNAKSKIKQLKNYVNAFKLGWKTRKVIHSQQVLEQKGQVNDFQNFLEEIRADDNISYL